MRVCSIYRVLTMLANLFDYVNYDNVTGMPNNSAARAMMPAKQLDGRDTKSDSVSKVQGTLKRLDDDNSKAADTKNHIRCKVCVNAAVKASFDRKVKSLIKTLLDGKKTTRVIEREGTLVTVQVDDSFAGLCLGGLTKT
ncbi:hypothetical protein diail_9911 [Diaporthe ilicicola]|nr:hypothetical protein diail_9911 [Diaporthe ilicicola]